MPKITLLFATIILHLILLPSAFSEEESWTFVSTPDFLNIDVGDLTAYTGPEFHTPSGNSTNASWENAIDIFLDGIAAENPDFLAVAGDLVMARWFQDATFEGVFEKKVGDPGYPTRTVEVENNRIINATNFYYSQWKDRFANRGPGGGLLPFYCLVGDHELGDDPSWEDAFGKLTTETHRQQFATHFVDPLFNDPATWLATGSSLYSGGGSAHPPTGQHASTAYAIQHKNLLLISIDVFKRVANNSISVTIADEQLAWLDNTLQAAQDEPSIDHIVVQGHAPALQPVAQRVSSSLKIAGAENSAFWQLLRQHKADLYLAGEVHDITVSQDGNLGLTQIAHGGIFGFSAANTISYLKGTVTGPVIHLELKELGFTVSGGQFYQPGNPVTQLKDTITVNTQAGFVTVGTVTIDKSLGFTRYLNPTGEFAGLVSPPAPDTDDGPTPARLGIYPFNTTGDETGYTLDTTATNVAEGIQITNFSAQRVGIFLSGSANQNRFSTGDPTTGDQWPGDIGSNGPSNFDETKYVGFSMSAASGKLLRLARLDFFWNRGGPKAPNDGVLRVSTDAFANYTEFAIFQDATSTNTDQPFSLDLSTLPLTEQVEFRFYFKDQDLSGTPSMRLDNVEPIGTIVPQQVSNWQIELGETTTQVTLGFESRSSSDDSWNRENTLINVTDLGNGETGIHLPAGTAPELQIRFIGDKHKFIFVPQSTSIHSFKIWIEGTTDLSQPFQKLPNITEISNLGNGDLTFQFPFQNNNNNNNFYRLAATPL